MSKTREYVLAFELFQKMAAVGVETTPQYLVLWANHFARHLRKQSHSRPPRKWSAAILIELALHDERMFWTTVKSCEAGYLTWQIERQKRGEMLPILIELGIYFCAASAWLVYLVTALVSTALAF